MPVDFTSFSNILNEEKRIYNLTGSSAALLLALCDEPFLAVELTEELAGELCKDANFFREALKKEPVLLLPEPNGPSLSGERAKVVHALKGEGSLVTSLRNLKSPVWSKEELDGYILNLSRGMEISRTHIEKRLGEMGYQNVSLVVEQGEYSRRGWLLDIFPSASESPLRLEFFGDEIENIKIFDVDTQRSAADVSQFLIFPAVDPPSGRTLLESMDGRRYFFQTLFRKEMASPRILHFSQDIR